MGRCRRSPLSGWVAREALRSDAAANQLGTPAASAGAAATATAARAHVSLCSELREVRAAQELRQFVLLRGMLRRRVLWTVALFLLFSEQIFATDSSANSGKGVTKARLNRGYYGDNVYEQSQTEIGKKERTTVKPSTTYNSKNHGFSAWGIVGVVLAVILCGVGIYYTILFYPLICKKERKYDVIELNAV